VPMTFPKITQPLQASRDRSCVRHDRGSLAVHASSDDLLHKAASSKVEDQYVDDLERGETSMCAERRWRTLGCESG